MLKRISAITLVLLLMLFFTSCQDAASSVSSSEEGGVKRKIANDILYDIPADWGTASDGLNGIIHYPPDAVSGDIMYVTYENWAPVDMSNSENGDKLMEETAARLGDRFSDFMIVNHSEDPLPTFNSLDMEFIFTMTIEPDDSSNQSASAQQEEEIAAVGRGLYLVHGSYIYTFLFIYPPGSGSVMETNVQAIIDSIR